MTSSNLLPPRLFTGFLVLPVEPASDDCRCVPIDRTHASNVKGSVVVKWEPLSSLHNIMGLSLICRLMEVSMFFYSKALVSQHMHEWSNASQLLPKSLSRFKCFCSQSKFRCFRVKATLVLQLSKESQMGNRVDGEQSRTTVQHVFSDYQVWIRVNEAELTGKCGEHALGDCKPGNHGVVRCVKWSSLCSLAQQGPQM